MAKAKTQQSDTIPQPVQADNQAPQFALGIVPELIELENYGYVQQRADVQIPRGSRQAIKRLAMTLDATEATLEDGTLVKNSIPKAIAWLVERFAGSISTIEKPIDGE